MTHVSTDADTDRWALWATVARPTTGRTASTTTAHADRYGVRLVHPVRGTLSGDAIVDPITTGMADARTVAESVGAVNRGGDVAVPGDRCELGQLRKLSAVVPPRDVRVTERASERDHRLCAVVQGARVVPMSPVFTGRTVRSVTFSPVIVTLPGEAPQALATFGPHPDHGSHVSGRWDLVAAAWVDVQRAADHTAAERAERAAAREERARTHGPATRSEERRDAVQRSKRAERAAATERAAQDLLTALWLPSGLVADPIAAYRADHARGPIPAAVKRAAELADAVNARRADRPTIDADDTVEDYTLADAG